MLFVATTGPGSSDTYARELAKRMEHPALWTDVYERQDFSVPLLTARTIQLALRDLGFIRRLRRERKPVHFPNQHFGRYAHLLPCACAISVHDLIRYFDLGAATPYISRPNLRDRWYLRLDYGGVRRADAVIVPSETTKRDVVEHLRVPEERVFVVHLGVDHDRFRPVSRRVIDGPYVLFVGSEHPRKNLETVLRAFRRVKACLPMSDLKLVKIGDPGDSVGSFRAQTLAAVRSLRLDSDVIFAGRVPEDDLPSYYSGAVCLVLPSLYEGFGLPPLEAMACGCPAIVSDDGALKEIHGEGALPVASQDDGAIAEAIMTLLVDEGQFRKTAERGLRHAQRFSWDRTAAETIAVYGVIEAESA